MLCRLSALFTALPKAALLLRGGGQTGFGGLAVLPGLIHWLPAFIAAVAPTPPDVRTPDVRTPDIRRSLALLDLRKTAPFRRLYRLRLYGYLLRCLCRFDGLSRVPAPTAGT